MTESATIEPPQDQQNKASLQPKQYRINQSNASSFGKLGAIARNEQTRALKKQLADALSKLELQRPIVEQFLAQQTAGTFKIEDSYQISQLIRTRKALDDLYSDFDGTNDPKERKFLADAIARLSDVEFALAKRPKPGTTRPSREKPARTGATGGPIDAE